MKPWKTNENCVQIETYFIAHNIDIFSGLYKCKILITTEKKIT